MENRPPNVLVSSTMYDLSHLRRRLREFTEWLGWRAVMAEHGSFSVDATETTVENSLRNVRENTDIFVMIVGARYGSIDPDADKSVTNLEFGAARAGGVPTYVSVDRNVLAQPTLPTPDMHPQRPVRLVVDIDDLHIAQSHQQLADARGGHTPHRALPGDAFARKYELQSEADAVRRELADLVSDDLTEARADWVERSARKGSHADPDPAEQAARIVSPIEGGAGF